MPVVTFLCFGQAPFFVLSDVLIKLSQNTILQYTLPSQSLLSEIRHPYSECSLYIVLYIQEAHFRLSI